MPEQEIDAYDAYLLAKEAVKRYKEVERMCDPMAKAVDEILKVEVFA